MTHPHAEILRAIADGVPLSEFEVWHETWESQEFLPVGYYLLWVQEPSSWKVRRKPRTHVVNGFTVPAPMDKEPGPMDIYFYPTVHHRQLADHAHWSDSGLGDSWDQWIFSHGLCFATKEAAIANAKAMLKIDPEAV